MKRVLLLGIFLAFSLPLSATIRVVDLMGGRGFYSYPRRCNGLR